MGERWGLRGHNTPAPGDDRLTKQRAPSGDSSPRTATIAPMLVERPAIVARAKGHHASSSFSTIVSPESSDNDQSLPSLEGDVYSIFI